MSDHGLVKRVSALAGFLLFSRGYGKPTTSCMGYLLHDFSTIKKNQKTQCKPNASHAASHHTINCA